MRRLAAGAVLVLALAGCASPRADLQDQVAQVTAAANDRDVQGLLSEAQTLEALVDRLEDSGELSEAEATGLRNAAVALQQRAGQVRPAATSSPTPSPTPEPTQEEPVPTFTVDPVPEVTVPEETEPAQTEPPEEPAETEEPQEPQEPEPTEPPVVPVPTSAGQESEPPGDAEPTTVAAGSPSPTRARRTRAPSSVTTATPQPSGTPSA